MRRHGSVTYVEIVLVKITAFAQEAPSRKYCKRSNGNGTPLKITGPRLCGETSPWAQYG